MNFDDALITLFVAEYAEKNNVSFEECMRHVKNNRSLSEPIKDTIDTYHSINYENARGVFYVSVGEWFDNHFFVRVN